jgi:hypothetical protein
MPPEKPRQDLIAPCFEVLLLEFFASTDCNVFFFCGLGLVMTCYTLDDKPSHFKHLMVFAWLLLVESMAIVQGNASVQTVCVGSTAICCTVVIFCKQVNPDLLVMYTGGLYAMMFACMVSSLWLPNIHDHTFCTMWTTNGWQNTVTNSVAYCVQNIHTYVQVRMKDPKFIEKWIQATLVCGLSAVVVFVLGFFLVMYQIYVKIQDDKIIDDKNSTIDDKNSTIDDKNSTIDDGKKIVEDKSAEIAQLLSAVTSLTTLCDRLQAQAPPAQAPPAP